jgi:hypothetical protein
MACDDLQHCSRHFPPIFVEFEQSESLCTVDTVYIISIDLVSCQLCDKSLMGGSVQGAFSVTPLSQAATLALVQDPNSTLHATRSLHHV